MAEEKRAWAAVTVEEPPRSPRPRDAVLPAPASAPADGPPSNAAVVGSVLFYLVAALVMVLGNKAVLNAAPDTPLFFVFAQLVVAVILFQLGAVCGYVSLPTLTRDVGRGIGPLIACNVVGLSFNTLCLALVDASFYQVARGLVLPLTVVFQTFAVPGARAPSLPVLGGIVIVCVGFAVGVLSERRSFVNTSSLGVFLGVLSSCTTAVHAIVLKRSMGATKMGTLELAYLNNLLSAAALAPITLLAGEGPAVGVLLLGDADGQSAFVRGALITGVFGFLICIAGFISIKVTSPTTHMISSAVRGVVQTWLGVAVFGDTLTSGRTFGIAFILAGSAFYTLAKAREAAAARSGTGEREPPPVYRSQPGTPEKDALALDPDPKRRLD